MVCNRCCFDYFFQAYVAVLFARVIDNRPDVVTLLREVGFVIFSILTIYFLFFAKDPIAKKKRKSKRAAKKPFLPRNAAFWIEFLSDSLLCCRKRNIGFVQTVYIRKLHYLNICIRLCSRCFWNFVQLHRFFWKNRKKTDYFMRNMNTIIGTITGLVAVATLFNILNYYFG